MHCDDMLSISFKKLDFLDIRDPKKISVDVTFNIICSASSQLTALNIERMLVHYSEREQPDKHKQIKNVRQLVEGKEKSPSPQGDFLVVMWSTLVGIRTGPFNLSCLPLAPFTRSPQTAHTTARITCQLDRTQCHRK